MVVLSTMPKERPIRLPKRIERWRDSNWKAILAEETIVGHSLTLIRAVQREISEVNRFKEKKTLSKPRLRAKTHGILLALSELADEMYEARLKRKTRFRSRLQAFQNALHHYWPLFPPELQQEIIRQSKEE